MFTGPGRKTNQTVKERGTALSGSLSWREAEGDTKTDSHFCYPQAKEMTVSP